MLQIVNCDMEKLPTDLWFESFTSLKSKTIYTLYKVLSLTNETFY